MCIRDSNIDDAIPMPDGEILVHPAGKKDCGCVADNADSVWVGTSAARFRPAPDAGVGVVTGKAVNQMKVPAADGDLQAVRQPGEKTQDVVSPLGRAMVEQLPVGFHAAILPPQLPGTEFIVGPQGAQAHLLMVAQEHGHVGSLHDLLQYLYAARATVDHIPEDVQMICVRKMDLLQHLQEKIPFSVEVCHTIDHRLASVRNRVTEFYHTVQQDARKHAGIAVE